MSLSRVMGEPLKTGSIASKEVNVRKARSEDLAGIYNLMLEVLSDEIPLVDQLLRDGFEISPPWLHVLLAETEGEPVGAAVYYRFYWSWTGRTVFLRSLCVRKSARRCGVGSKLFRELCQVALEENAQLDWFCPGSETAVKSFFAQFKPNVNQNLDGTYVMRITPHAIREASQCRKRILNEEVSVRMACREDMAQLEMLIHEISAFQELSDGPELHTKDLAEDGFTSSPPWFFALVACLGGSVVGAVMGSRVYTRWARGLYLQSLYVRPRARRQGIADLLIIEFARVAESEKAEYIDFNVAPENTPAESLYRRYHAVPVSTFDGFVAHRLNRQSLQKLVTHK